MKKLMILVLLFTALLVGFNELKSAADFEHGISIEVQNEGISHINIQVGNFDENVIHADSTPFKKGEILYFDKNIRAGAEASIVVSYSTKIDGTDPERSEITVTAANPWIELQLTEDNQLQIKQ